MNNYYVVSFSGGKDSTAMLLELMRIGARIDEVIFCDTYKEFPAMYRHIEKVKNHCLDNNISFTILKNEKTFDYYMLEHKVKRRKPEEFRAKYGDVVGYSWADSRNRWCTQLLKTQIINKYLREKNKEYMVIQYVGIAADETHRLERKITEQGNKQYPLVEWGWTEQQCLEYCYALGYDWEGLYNHFNRVSCWCCPLKNLDELRKLYKYYPDLWQELKDMDNKTWRKFKQDYTVEELEKRFEFEEAQLTIG